MQQKEVKSLRSGWGRLRFRSENVLNVQVQKQFLRGLLQCQKSKWAKRKLPCCHFYNCDIIQYTKPKKLKNVKLPLRVLILFLDHHKNIAATCPRVHKMSRTMMPFVRPNVGRYWFWWLHNEKTKSRQTSSNGQWAVGILMSWSGCNERCKMMYIWKCS